MLRFRFVLTAEDACDDLNCQDDVRKPYEHFSLVAARAFNLTGVLKDVTIPILN